MFHEYADVVGMDRRLHAVHQGDNRLTITWIDVVEHDARFSRCTVACNGQIQQLERFRQLRPIDRNRIAIGIVDGQGANDIRIVGCATLTCHAGAGREVAITLDDDRRMPTARGMGDTGTSPERTYGHQHDDDNDGSWDERNGGGGEHVSLHGCSNLSCV
jgi:hypothetical protein